MCYFGFCYTFGQSVTQKYTQTAFWYQVAAFESEDHAIEMVKDALK